MHPITGRFEGTWKDVLFVTDSIDLADTRHM